VRHLETVCGAADCRLLVQTVSESASANERTEDCRAPQTVCGIARLVETRANWRAPEREFCTASECSENCAPKAVAQKSPEGKRSKWRAFCAFCT